MSKKKRRILRNPWLDTKGYLPSPYFTSWDREMPVMVTGRGHGIKSYKDYSIKTKKDYYMYLKNMLRKHSAQLNYKMLYSGAYYHDHCEGGDKEYGLDGIWWFKDCFLSKCKKPIVYAIDLVTAQYEIEDKAYEYAVTLADSILIEKYDGYEEKRKFFRENPGYWMDEVDLDCHEHFEALGGLTREVFINQKADQYMKQNKCDIYEEFIVDAFPCWKGIGVKMIIKPQPYTSEVINYYVEKFWDMNEKDWKSEVPIDSALLKFEYPQELQDWSGWH